MEILYADAALVVCVKPAGPDCEQGVPAALAAQLSGPFFPVHRLDAAVGGVLAVARTPAAAAALTRSLTAGGWHKDYYAVTRGIPAPAAGALENWLFWDRRQHKSFAVSRPRRGVREARLHYRVLAEAADAGRPLALVAVAPDTGRTHQIRVQFAARRHPLLGDGRYGGGDSRCTPALWAARLTLPHPLTGGTLTLTAPPPAAFPWSLFPPDRYTLPDAGAY